MALYKTTAFGPPYKATKRMQTGALPLYLFGRRDEHTEPFMFHIDHIAGSGSAATATVSLVSGGGGVGGATGAEAPSPIPVAGAVMGVRGLALTGFNTDPTTVTSVSLNSLGVGTIVYPNSTSHANAADNGDLVVWPFEYPDLVALNSASAPYALAFSPDESDNSRCLFAEAVWSGTTPTAATVSLQVANIDQDARYVTVGAINIIAASTVTQQGAEFSFLMGKFIRAKVTAMTGGDGTTGLVCTVFA